MDMFKKVHKLASIVDAIVEGGTTSFRRNPFAMISNTVKAIVLGCVLGCGWPAVGPI